MGCPLVGADYVGTRHADRLRGCDSCGGDDDEGGGGGGGEGCALGVSAPPDPQPSRWSTQAVVGLCRLRTRL